MTQSNYASAHPTASISAKRFQYSPYFHCYANPQAVLGVYAKRFYPLSLGEDPIKRYWALRQNAVMFDVPEKPIEISGPDAVRLLERVFCRHVASLKVDRARYAIACLPDGGILMDGVLMRLGEDRFWYVQADGEFETWLRAHALGLDVAIRDPNSWALQIQGPNSLAVLAAASDDGGPENFGYFHVRECRFGGQDLLISRTGWTGELGFEIYTNDKTDGEALWCHVMAAGEATGLVSSALESMGIRRIEAGILDNGTDIDPSMTPFDAGLGAFVDLDNKDFIGREALLNADREPLLHGLTCPSAAPLSGLKVLGSGTPIGHMTAGAWSPYLDCGVGYVRLRAAGLVDAGAVTLVDREGNAHPAGIVPLPFYDAAKEIPRGLDKHIPLRNGLPLSRE